jgi:crossover junction endodeoxyribonuclease RusA
MIDITLPWPPTVNTYWLRRPDGKGVRVSAEGVSFREHCQWQAMAQKANIGMAGPLVVHITAHMPDKRRRDLDNILKALLDGLTHSGVWGDDSQVVDLRIVKAPTLGGMVKVNISEA